MVRRKNFVAPLKSFGNETIFRYLPVLCSTVVLTKYFSLGSQTFSKISEAISCIIQEYRLEGKVQHIVTDNGFNFVKAVKDYFQNKASDASVVVSETSTVLVIVFYQSPL